MDFYDYYFTMVIAVKLEYEQEFLNKLSPTDRKVLEENPDGIVERDDGDSRLPNQTFVKNGYKVFVRRREENDEVFQNINSIYSEHFEDEYGEESLAGFLLYLHAQRSEYIDNFGSDSLSFLADDLSAEIIYTIGTDYKLDKGNDIDYSPLNSLDNDNTSYAAIAISLESGTTKLFHQILPEELKEYLSKMGSHYHSDDKFDGNEDVYILLNVPFKTDINNFDDENVYIGQKFLHFFEENTDKLLEHGDFNALIAPQDDILLYKDYYIDNGNYIGNIEFKTPMSISLDFCDYIGMIDSAVTEYIGEISYYGKGPAYLIMTREVYFPHSATENNKVEGTSRIATKDSGCSPNLHDSFRDYLIAQGYKEYTDSGKPSTVYDYIKRVETVCKEEGLNWETFAESINRIVDEYARGGEKEELGRQSHDAVINALKAYQRFIEGNGNSNSTYIPVEADLEISFFIRSEFTDKFFNGLSVDNRKFFENTDEAEGPVFVINDGIATMRWHYPEEIELKPETVIKAVKSIPVENWLLHVCPQYGLDGPCQSVGALLVPDAIFEYEFYFESDEYPEDMPFDDEDSVLPMNIIGFALSPEGAGALAKNLSEEIKERLEPFTAFHMSEEDTGEIGIYLNVPGGKNSMSEKLEKIFSKLDPDTYALFVIPQTGFIDEWQFSNTFPGGMKADIHGDLEDLPFDFSLRQYC